MQPCSVARKTFYSYAFDMRMGVGKYMYGLVIRIWVKEMN